MLADLHRLCYPPSDVQLQIGNLGDNLQNLRDELQQTALDEQKKRIVGAFYIEIEHDYGGLRRNETIDYKQFEVESDGKTLYWVHGDKKICVSAVKGAIHFRSRGTLANEWGSGGTNAIKKQLGLRDYTSKATRSLRSEATSKLQHLLGSANLPSSSELDSVLYRTSPLLPREQKKQ